MAQWKWRSWVTAGVLGGIVAGLTLSGPARHPRPTAPAPPPTPRMAALAAPTSASEWASSAPLPSSATPAPPAAGAAPSGEVHALALAQFEAQWCSAGRQAHQQQMASLEQSFGPHPRMALLRAAASLPFNRFQAEVQRRVVIGWVATLARSADPHDQATALFLRATERHLLQEADTDPVQAFEALAARTADPYVLHLWRRQDALCLQGDECRLLPLARWSQLDPSNAAAWLPQGFFGPAMTEAQWQGLAQARTFRTYHLDLQARLLALVRDTPPGIELEIALNHIERLREFEHPGIALQTACKQPDLSAGQQASCLRVATLVWSQDRPSAIDRDMAVLTAKRLGPLDAQWQARADEVQFLNDLDYASFKAAVNGPTDRTSDCSGLAKRRQRMLDLVAHGEWALVLRDHAAPPAR